MNNYYDRQGQPISIENWLLKSQDNDYRILKQQTLPNGALVSTVWLGVNHQFGDGPPLIFETMTFHAPDGQEDCERYSTEVEALEGHARMVAKWEASK